MDEEFDEAGFWTKLGRYAKVAGREAIEKSLWLFYAAQSPATPTWARSVIYGALAYFVLPFDAIPDMLPVAGYTDDLTALLAALGAVAMYVDDDVKHKAKAKLVTWFGDDTDESDEFA